MAEKMGKVWLVGAGPSDIGLLTLKGLRVLEQAQADQNVQARPALAAQVEGMERYDTIILGYPNWWASIPMPVATFLESYDFAGKKIILFATSGGSGLGSSDQDLSAVCPDADIKNGKMLNGRLSEEELRQWVESLNL